MNNSFAGFEMDFPDRIKVSSHIINIVPRYVETDKAGVVHHSVYPVWFEMGRTELLRAGGCAYKDLEEAGFFFVMVELNVKYRRPAYYDQSLELQTICTKITPARIEHTYILKRNSDGVIIAEGSSVLAHVDAGGKPRRIPDFMCPDDLCSN